MTAAAILDKTYAEVLRDLERIAKVSSFEAQLALSNAAEFIKRARKITRNGESK